MNIFSINSDLKYINRIGQTLSTEQRITIQLSVSKLSQEYKYEVFNFWGRVEGVLKNYYILEAINYKGTKGFPIVKYFWSSEDFKFAQLPEARKQFTSRINKINYYFTGQHEKILFRSEEPMLGVSMKIFGHQDNKPKNEAKSKHFTQLDRLSLVVNQVDHDCQVVPLGAYKIIPTHQLISNPNFKGLKIDQSKHLSHYVHRRAPVLSDKKLLIESDKALERDDFLDPISQDQNKKCWSLQTDESKTEITLRNLVWPGYIGYHRTNSNIFGGLYMGNGIKSQDFAFLI